MSYSDNFWELRKKKKKEEENTPKRDKLGNLSFNGAIAALDNTDIAPVAPNIKHSDVQQWKKEIPKSGAGAGGGSNSGGIGGGNANTTPRIKDRWQEAISDGYDFGDITKSILGISEDSASLKDLTINSAKRGYYNALYGEESFRELSGEKNNKEYYKQLLSGEDYQFTPNGDIAEGVSGAFEQLGQTWRQLTNPRTVTAVTGAMGVAALAGQAGPQALLPEEVVSIPVAAGIGFMSGGAINALEIEGGLAYNEMLEAGISKETAQKVALGVGTVNAGLELLQLDELMGAYKVLKKSGASKSVLKKITNELLDRGVDVAKETVQEVGQEFVTIQGTQLASKIDTGEKAYSTEEVTDRLLDTAKSSALTFGMMNVPAAAKNTTSIVAEQNKANAVNKLTESEEAVVNKVYEDYVAEAEKNGKKLTNSEKNKLREKAIEEMEKGYIDTDTIESVIGGDVYKMYQNSLEKDTKAKATLETEIDQLVKTPEAQFTIEQRERLTELRERLKELENDGTTQSWKETLDTEISQKLQNSRIVESYNEQTRRGQTFEADISKYDKKQQAVIQKAIDSGILNNTNRTHDFVDMVAKISADKGVSFDFTDNEKLKNSGFALNGKTVNGYVTKDGVTLNIDSHKALNRVVGHEITHVLEGTELYTELQNTLFEYAKTKGEYDSRLANLTELYKGVKDADVNAELTADLVGDYLFADGDFITHLSTTNRNVFQKIYDEVKYLYKIATAGSKEARELERVKRAFDKAYKESGKATSGTKYSVSDKNIKEVSTGYAYNETYFTMSYTQDGKVVGTLEYGEYDGAPNVKMVQVDPEYRRKGIATKLLQELQNKYPDTEIDFGMSTPDGTKLLDAITYDVTDEAVATDRQKLKDLQTELNDLQEKLDVLYDTDNLTEEQENELHSLGDRWQDVYETISKLEKELRGKRSTKTFVKTDTKYSVSDSDGKQLTAEQSEYFKNSKMRDDNGNLKVMYHGSQDAGFHVFDPSMSDDNTSLFFVDRNDVAASYSGTSETYEAQTIRSAEDMNKFIESIGAEGYEVTEKDGKFTLLYENERVADSNTAQGIYDEFCWYEGVGEGDANYKVYLNLENPLEIDAKGRPWNKIDAEFSQEIYDRYQSLTAEEKAALTDLTEWEDFSLFNSEIQEAKDNEIASAYEKLGGDDANIYDIFTIAADNFNEETLRENAVTYLKTRDYAQRAKEQGYDGVIFKNIRDNGGYSNGSEGASTVAIAFSSEQIKSVANNKPTADKDIRYSLSEDSNGNQLSPAVQKRFGNSKVVDENGALKVVYHGTATGEFSIFDKTKGSVEGDFGSGFYFTDNEADVSEHYEGGGPDFDNKVGRRADEIWGEEPDIEYEEAERRAREELFKGSHKFEVYLNIENPAIVGETTLLDPDKYWGEYDRDDYDRDEDYEGDVEQLIIDDIDGILWDIQRNLDVDNTDGIANVLYDAIYNGGIDIEVLKENINNLYLDNDKGELIGNEVTRQIIESLGYDGIVDPTVSSKWNMNIEDGTTHYIVFKPNQIKAITNQDPTDNPDIHYSVSADGDQLVKHRYADDIYGEDIRVNKSTQNNAIPPLPSAETKANTMENGVIADEFAPITEEEANAMQSENLNSLTDADVPPEVDAPYYAPREAITIDSEGLKKITDSVNSILYLDAEDSADMAYVIQGYAQNENITREQLAEHIRSRFEFTEEIDNTEANEEIKRAKRDLRGKRIYVPEEIRSEFNGTRRDGYNAFRKEHLGHFYLTSNPSDIGIDSLYQELSDAPEKGGYPDLFPPDIINPADQLRQMAEIASTKIEPEYHSMPYDEDTIQTAVNAIESGIAQYSQDDMLAWANEQQSVIDEYHDTKPFAPIAPDMDGVKTTSVEVVKDISPTPPSAPTPPPSEQSDRVAKRLQPKTAKEAKQERRKKNGRLWSLFRNHFVDKQSSVEDLSLKTKNRELMGKANFMLLSDARAQRFISKGAEGAKSLNDIRKEVQDSGLYEEFEEYLDHKHNVDRMSIESNAQARIAELQGKFGNLRLDQIWAIAKKEITDKTTEKTAQTIKEAREYLNALEAHNKPVFGDSVTAEKSATAAAQYEAQYPQFAQWAQEIYSINKYLRQMMVDNGIISQETADLWEKMYPHYVPTTRAEYNGAAINVPLDTNRTGVNAPIKGATGGNSDMVDTFEAIADRIEQTFRAVAKNNFGVELKNTLEAARGGANKASGIIPNDTATDIDTLFDIVERHDELLKKGENGAPPTFTVFENGERVEFEITEDLYEALKPTSEGLKKTIPVVSHAANLHKKVLTEYNLAFAVTNAIKDAQSVIVNSQHPVRTYMSFPEAIGQLIMGRGQWIDEYMANGGEELTYFEGDTKRFKDDDGTFKKIVGLPLKGISWVNNFVEKIPRLAEYIASRKAGASIDVAMLDAARVTTNFSASGDVTKFANRNGATFLNASVQGAAQQVRNIREAKAKGLKGVLGLVGRYAAAGLPAVLFNALMWDDDEEYEELSDYVKDNYYVVAKFGDGQFIRIPKGREVAVIQKATELIADVLKGEGEIGFTDIKDLGSLAMSNLAPNNPIKNNIISPISQALKNEAWYGGDIVPTRLQDVPADEQHDESIDLISKWLGEKTDLSPYKINYLLDQYSGIVGDMFLPMLTPEAEGGSDTFGSKIIAPIKDKFTTDSVTNNKTISDFYDMKDELTKNAKSVKATDEDVLKYKYINSVNDEISELYKQQREIQNSNMTDSKKYIAVRDIQKQINELAKNAMSEYESASIDDYYATVGDRHYRLNDKGEWTKLTDEQIEKQEKVTRGLGISASDYWSNKEENDFAYEKPEKYAVTKAVGGYTAYKQYTGEIYDIKGVDLDGDGRSDSGTRKEKVIDYLNNLDIDYYEKLILFKSEYNADDTYNYEIVDYLNGRDDISYEDTVIILKELGFDVDANGNVTWD